MAEMVEGGIARRDEEIGAGIVDSACLPGPEKPGVGLLHQVVNVLQGGEVRPKIGPKRSFVRLHLFGKPTGLLWLSRIQGLNSEKTRAPARLEPAGKTSLMAMATSRAYGMPVVAASGRGASRVRPGDLPPALGRPKTLDGFWIHGVIISL